MGKHIVVAFRMPPAGISQGPEGAYLPRARSMCARGEALGGRLVAWSAALLAIAWDSDSMEEAILLATSLREGALSPESAWSCGVSEGALESLAPDGQRMHLAWGDALLESAALARVAKPGEVLVGGGVEALKSGLLSLVGARSSTDAGRRVRGWRLDLDRPWKANSTASWPAVASTAPSEPPQAASVERHATLADRVRATSRGDSSQGPVMALFELRNARAQAEGGPPAARCQAALALAVALSLLGRSGEGLLDALDALGCARESGDPKAITACVAMIARLYSSAGYADAASKLSKLVEEAT
ncbi:MAG: hypothetical protein ACREJ3_08880 [Polyangiaceae bacterium]